MTLFFPLLDEPLRFEENRIQVLIIENPVALRRCLDDLRAQMEGQSGDFVLALRYVPQELSRCAVLLTDPLRPEAETRKLAVRIQQEAARAAEDHAEKLGFLLAELNALASDLSLELDFSAAFDPLETPEDLIKLFGFRLDRDALSFPELLLEWMRLQRRFLGKRLFILYGLKAFLSREELCCFYRSVFYEKLDVLLIEALQRGEPVKEECVTIIDKDLCVIS